MGKKSKSIRTKGKLQLSRYFQEFNEGDLVSVVREKSVESSFPARLQGRTGRVESKRGRSYMIKLKDINQGKRFLIKPIHLKKVGEPKLLEIQK
ncbi:MAG: 50S ribosomal protein L21e [Nanoarchaeota archaeon]|nr:50S ribosomal protein L21e [Nanoarchaeota archaeon]MBU1501441.1 50S ribosomal protein L21e [Nanoarchaeota archaeon]MBU2458959.1 50S ribosomal protein L21e [Nanoarchaeota archaeon]